MEQIIQNTEKKLEITKCQQPKRRLRVGDPDFVPPDGGWGWLIVFACGFGNLSTFPMVQQFGLVFRERFLELGFTSAQTTSVININSAFNAGVGLLNGPLYRNFTYRQVAIFGSLLVATSLFFCQYVDNFYIYLILYSTLYGAGIGLSQSSNALALNTYFKEKRRLATGFSWTTTGIGPIVWPYIIVFLNDMYGVKGTLLLFSGFALHAFMCSLLLHPVEWHTKFKEIDAGPESAALLENGGEKSARLRKNVSFFSSQYLHNEDDPVYTGYEITDPGTPMMLKSNDGWYSRSQMGSRISLASSKSRKFEQASKPMSSRPSASNLLETERELRRDRSSSIGKRKHSQIGKPTIAEEVEPDQTPKENETLQEAAKILKEYKDTEQATSDGPKETQPVRPLTLWQKISIFFDFELFTDPTYVNLMLGITVANFAELNFSVLTPMVLAEFKFQPYEIATFMSLLGATDIIVRFFIPFVADKIDWENKTFFLVGVLAMALGRIILVHTQQYYWGLLVAVIIGAGKGLRTIFIALVIPSYVPLERLPAASGLQLATSGILFIVLGPVVGWIRDAVNNYVITLHLLNICTYGTAIAWITGDIARRRDRREEGKISKSFKTPS